MDFAFSDEQRMLRGQARAFLSDRVPLDRVAELADSDEGWDDKTWPEMAELGWTGLSIPEASGGAGSGFLEEAVLFEELGYALYPGPYLSSIALARPALDDDPGALGALAAGEATYSLAWAETSRDRLSASPSPRTTATEGSAGWEVTGEKVLVADGGIVDRLVVVAGADDSVALLTVSARDARIESLSTMDRTRRLARVAFDKAPAHLLATGPKAEDVLARIETRAFAALALEAVGVAQRALELSIEHAKTREQFGKPIGSYQAVSHQVADAYVDVELARSLAYWAAWSVAEHDDRAAIAAASAKALAAENAVAACERAIQVHGGIGFTFEHPLHRFYKRAQWIDSFGGFGAEQRAAVAADVLDG